MNKSATTKCFILKLESFDGADTFMHCGDSSQDFLYCIVAHTKTGEVGILDNGYRSLHEALNAWPEAKPVAD